MGGESIMKIKWLINDLGLNELDAWLWMTGGAALTAAVMVLLVKIAE
jgi:hypothetical protein